MKKKCKTLLTEIEEPKILIYDSKQMIYLTGTYGSIDYSCDPLEYNYGHNSMGISETRVYGLNSDIKIHLNDTNELSNVELDPTTMKRIEQFNKGQEIKRLDKEIEEKKKEINNIEEILNDRTKRLKKLKEFIRYL